MSCGVGGRRGSDPTLLWLWWRPEAVALILPLAWEFPCAMGVTLKKKKKSRKQTAYPNIKGFLEATKKSIMSPKSEKSHASESLYIIRTEEASSGRKSFWMDCITL